MTFNEDQFHRQLHADFERASRGLPSSHTVWVTWSAAKTAHRLLYGYHPGKRNRCACGVTVKDQKGLRVANEIADDKCESCYYSREMTITTTINDLPPKQRNKLQQKIERQKFLKSDKGVNF